MRKDFDQVCPRLEIREVIVDVNSFPFMMFSF